MTRTADPREILAAVYEGKFVGAYPMTETSAAAQLAKLGATVAEVGHVMTCCEQDTRFWASRVQSAASLLQYWPRLRKQFVETKQHRPYEDTTPPKEHGPRDLRTWGNEHRFSSDEARADFMRRRDAMAQRIEALQRSGVRGHHLFGAISGGGDALQTLLKASAECTEQVHWSEPAEPAPVAEIVRLDERRPAEPEPERAGDELLEELEEVAF